MTARRSSRVPNDPNLSVELRDFLDRLDRRIPNSNYAATAAPAVTDDEDHGYDVGSQWVDRAGDDVYVCVDATAGAAVWKKTTP